jgi:hypothetical protein
MAHRCLLLVFAVVLVTQRPGVNERSYVHPGTIVDAVNGKAIEARAYAYGSPELVGDNNCPVYKDALDAAHTQVGTGSFMFRINEGKPSYTAAYCENGYAPRTEDANDNSQDGTRVQPDPILLLPREAKLTSSHIDPVGASFVAIGRVLDRAQSDLSYLSKANEKAYYEALQRFSDPDQRTLKMLRERRPIGVLVNPYRFLRMKR